MAVRTFYWTGNSRRFDFFRRKRMFRVGNAGDIFNADVINWAYPGHRILNSENTGRRLMLVGSVAHRVLAGDVVAGVGSKRADLPAAPQGVSVRGVRGPLTEQAFRDAGYGMSELAFHGDPGLLIAKMYPALAEIEPELGRVAFIPHFRERQRYQSGAAYEVIDIDATAEDVARQIARSEAIYTSSLHGLVWANALGRPACLIVPGTEEPEFKYRDYLQSVGLPFEPANSIDDALRSGVLRTPDVTGIVSQITLPDAGELRARGVIV